MTRLAALLIAVLALSVAAAPATAAPKKASKSPEEISAYWTAERMQSAKPRERARPGGGGTGGGKVTDWTRYTVPTPYTGETAKNGKLFFTLDGSRYVCSATAVDSVTNGVNLIWTAGHCVTDGVDSAGVRHDATDHLFVPGYLNGGEPYGRWAGVTVDSTDSWERSNGQDFRFDTGAVRVVKMDRTGTDAGGNPTYTADPGETFADTVGTRAIQFGTLPLGTRVVSYGYPAAGKFNGQQQYACASPYRRTDPYNTAFPAPMQIGCDMTGGSSGGGWVRELGTPNNVADPGEPLISVNSYGYGFEKSTMYGPQLLAGGETQQLYQRMD